MSVEFDLSTIIPPLIGAISGSFGGNIIGDWIRHRNEKDALRKTIRDKYLFPLQDSVDSLWWRLENLRKTQKGVDVENQYYVISTLYAFGVVFAYNRILMLEGIYSQILIPGLGSFLKEKLFLIESEMSNQFKFHTVLYKYDRLALAESVLLRSNGKFQICTYLEFKEKYEADNSTIRRSLHAAKEFVLSLEGPELEKIMSDLTDTASRIEKETKILSSIRNRGSS